MEPVVRTLHSFLKEAAEEQPGKKLLGGPEGWRNAAGVCRDTEAIAWQLAQGGLGNGDLAAVKTTRTVETALLLLALQQAGVVAVLCDPHQEPEDVLRSCAVEIPVKAVLEAKGKTLLWTDPCTCQQRQLPFPGEQKAFPERNGNPKAPGFLIFTSGSTGKSKAVMLSQYNLVNNLLDSRPLGYYTGDDIALGALPLEHVFGLVLLAGIAVLGYGLYLPERTDVQSLLETIQTQRITRMNGVPSLYLALAEQAEGYDLSSLRAGFLGGSPSTAEQFYRMEEKLGMTLISVYGMSECIGIACSSYLDSSERRAGSVGKFYPRNTGALRKRDGSDCAPGEEGEIWVRGPSRMVGYYPEPLAEDAFFPTGDLGCVDEAGFLHITGRCKDILIRNGRNLSPRRIEEALLSVPGVEDAAVVGLPEARSGEVPWAAVVCRDGCFPLLEEALAGKLAKNELPVQIVRFDKLPQTASGKVDKQGLREVFLQWKA